MGRAGFTLLEISITLILLSVLAAFALPAFLRDATRPDIDEAQSRIEALFFLARDSAVRSSIPVTITLDSVSGQVWIQSLGLADSDPSRQDSASSALPRIGGTFGGGSTLGRSMRDADGQFAAEAAGDSLGLPPSVRIEVSSARAHFAFSPSGTASGDSVVLRSSSGEVRIITLDPWTGRAHAR